MKKITIVLLLLLGTSQINNAQVAFGVKGGFNYNSNSFSNVKDDVFSGAKSKTGYHAGIWVRFKIPIIGFYIRPELVYSHLNNSINYKPTGITSKSTSLSINKIDIPVLLGKKIFGIGNIYIGPSFQYILKTDFSLADIKNVKSKGFTLGLQFGGGIEIGNLGIDVRWERAFSSIETTFLNTTINNSGGNFDTRINQIIIGLSYKL